MTSGLELAYALMGWTAGGLFGLYCGVMTERMRTQNLRRIFRARVNRLRQPVAVPAVRPSDVDAQTFGDEGGAGVWGSPP